MTRRRPFESRTPWPALRTPRLLLRPLREDDLADIHVYGGDCEVTRFMTWGPNTPEDSRAALDRMLAEQAVWPRRNVNLAAERTADGRVIGVVSLWLVDRDHPAAEFGYSFAREAWGQGFATEAAAALIRHAFETLGLHRVIATCNVRNVGSWRVMEKLGMRREGHFRRDRKDNQGWRDTYLYAVLAREWRKARSGRRK